MYGYSEVKRLRYSTEMLCKSRIANKMIRHIEREGFTIQASIAPNKAFR